MHGNADRRFDAALRDRVHRKRAVIGLDPRGAAASARVLREAAVGVDQHRAARLVLQQPARLRVVHHRVADRVSVETEVVMEVELHIARFRARIAHHDAAHVDVRVGIDGVVAAQADADGLVVQDDVRDERVAQVFERALPRRRVRLVQGAVAPHAHEEARGGVVLHPHAGEVEVGEVILGIEGNEQRSVADG
jgi:hypothetical protein